MEHLLTALRPVLDAVERAGGSALIVGGAVRDALLGRESKDLDVEVYGLGVDKLAEALGALGRVNAVGRSFGVLKLRLPGGQEVDVALPQRRSVNPSGERGLIVAPDPSMTPREAAARRDFTWNAMALTAAGELIDYFDGQRDLRLRVIRHTSAAFGEDPLRVLRAVQFAARFDMRLAPETAALCRALLPEAPGLAIERVWGEWQKWALKGARPSAGLRALEESGWVDAYPELAALIGCRQHEVWHPEGDVYVHSGLVCDAAAALAERERLTDEQRSVLLFSALCHDLGKPLTTVIGEDGRIRSPGHAAAGVGPARTLLGRMGAPRWLVDRVAPLVREHMNHLSAGPTERAVRRLAVRLSPATIVEWRRLLIADSAGRPPLPAGDPGAAAARVAERIGAAEGRPAPLVTGQHLLDLGVEQGPALGDLLRRAYRAQIDGAFETVEEGIAWVREALR